MLVSLIFPPLCDPRAPQLALPSLAAHLRQHGVAVSLHDLNLDSLVDMFVPDRLTGVYEALTRRARERRSDALARAAAVAGRLVTTAPAALDALRRPDAFFEPMRHADARKILDEVTRTAAFAHGRVEASITPIHFGASGLDAASLRDLESATVGPQMDLFAPTTARLVAELALLKPLVAGISITNRQQIIPGLSLARRLREAGHFVAIGGAVFSKFRDQLRALPRFFELFADAVVVYEGETALLGLVTALADGRLHAGIPNLLFREGDTVVATSTHVEDVAKLPTPDFAGLPLGRYLLPSPVLPILTGKGCYFNRCKFCDIPYINHVSRKPYRVRPVEQVVNDCHVLEARHGATEFVITDEALPPRLLVDLADAFKRRPGRFSFTGYARPEPGFTPEACEKIAGMGVRKLFFGLESAAQPVLDHMDKGIRIQAVPDVLSNCRKAGIDFHLFGIIGLPEESAAQAAETPAFFVANAAAVDSPGSSFDVHPFGLELRTEYFLNSQSFGLVIDPPALKREFVLGLADNEWENTNGLSAAAVKQLISETFRPQLRQAFRQWHASPDPLWPPQEEYSVLYGNRFAMRPFEWRTARPRDPDRRFRFVPSNRMQKDEVGRLGLASLDFAFELPLALSRMVTSGRCETWRTHLGLWYGPDENSEAGDYVDLLIELGLLVLHVPSSQLQGAAAP